MEDGEGLNRLEQQRRSHELEHTALEISQIKHIGEKRNIRDFGETVGWSNICIIIAQIKRGTHYVQVKHVTRIIQRMRRGGMKMQCYEVLTVYMKLCNINKS